MTINTLEKQGALNFQSRPVSETLCANKDCNLSILASRKNEIYAQQERRAYKIREAADLIGISVTSLRRAITRGLIKPSRAFRHVIIASEEIDRFLRSTSGTS
ncbi:MAG: helix-turn-helix domain-containing protein [Prosthecobacter sp.]